MIQHIGKKAVLKRFPQPMFSVYTTPVRNDEQIADRLPGRLLEPTFKLTAPFAN
ncbi:hypothetical protein D3C84_1314450 [compost metagenome]